MRTQGPPKVLLDGKKFGRLLVTGFSHRNPKATTVYWRCLCDCGKETCVSTGDLSRTDKRQVRSCGCLKIARTIEVRTKHGQGGGNGKKESRTYQAWKNMLGRCNRKNRPDYYHYGGRGISVCDEWRDFRQFFKDMGEVPPGYSLERIDVCSGYAKDNCKWIPKREQPQNTRRSVAIRYNDKWYRPVDLATQLQVPADQLRRWAKDGKELEKLVARYKER